MNPLVVRSRHIVLPDGIRPAAVHVRDGRIVEIADHADVPSGVHLLDAGEHVVLPGLVDSHVHVNEPGRSDWEGIETASRAAAAGGVTTIVDMPLNSVPATTDAAGLRAKRDALSGRTHVDVGSWGGVVPGNTADLEPLAAAGVCGFKCFLSPSGVDEFEPVTERDLRCALPIVARLGLPLLVHAEDPAGLLPFASGGDPRRYDTWLQSRPAAAERAAVEMLIRLAEEFGARVHVVHLAAASAIESLRDARRRGVPITVETCPHYLTFCAEEIPEGATIFKCAPPIREAAVRERLWSALTAGDIDLVATDHSPAPAALKCLDSGDFTAAWGGIASLQLGLPAVWTGAVDRGLSLDAVASWMASHPALLAGLGGRKGKIAPGFDADLVFFDADATWTVDARALFHRHPICAYDGRVLRGRVVMTMLRGEVGFSEGAMIGAANGRLLLRASIARRSSNRRSATSRSRSTARPRTCAATSATRHAA